MGAAYRLGPELEICGYSLEDHFFEQDTVRHSWEVLADILSDPELTKDILCDIGLPVYFKGNLYNCRAYCLNQEVLLIRPKLQLAGGFNYKEGRWFKPWIYGQGRAVLEFNLPEVIQKVKG